MRYPQLVVYEADRRLATWLREAVEIAEMLRHDEEGQPVPSAIGVEAPRAWLLRETRQPAACLRLFQRGAPGILVMRLTQNEEEFSLLDQVTWRHPEVLSVVVGQDEHRSLAPLAWDLGATAVLLPPQVGERLQETVLGLMRSVMSQVPSDLGPNASEGS